MDSESFAWETSKENVKPLRKGRNVETLTKALTHTHGDKSDIEETRRCIDMDDITN